mgnify:FL=1
MLEQLLIFYYVYKKGFYQIAEVVLLSYRNKSIKLNGNQRSATSDMPQSQSFQIKLVMIFSLLGSQSSIKGDWILT